MNKKEWLEEYLPDALIMDGYDDCIIGVCRRYGQNDLVAYDIDKILNKLMKDGCTYEEALEYFEYNQIGAWMGDMTPVFIENIPEEV